MNHGRLHWFEPQELDNRQRALYDRITTSPRAGGPVDLTDGSGRLHGPFNAFLVAPEAGTAIADLGSAIRFRTSLTARAREIAILELAALRRSEFEWYAHVRLGAAAGLSAAEIAALASGSDVETFDRAEALVRAVTRALVTERDVAPPLAADFEAALGQREFMELIALVGCYDLLDLSMRVWRVPLPEGATSAFKAGGASNSGSPAS